MKSWLLRAMILTFAVGAMGQAQKPSAGMKAGVNTETETAAPAPALKQQATAKPGATDASALPVGTAVKMKLETMLSTVASKAGDTFAGRVTEDVVLDGKTVIPVGASVQGRVTKVTEPRRVKGVPTIEMKPEQVTMPNGDVYELSAVVVDADPQTGLNVNEEGAITGPGHDRRDVVVLGAGAGGGALVGALAGGGKGFVVGALVGGGGAVAHWLSRKHSAVVPAGTEIVMEISRPMAMRSAMAGEKTGY